MAIQKGWYYKMMKKFLAYCHHHRRKTQKNSLYERFQCFFFPFFCFCCFFFFFFVSGKIMRLKSMAKTPIIVPFFSTQFYGTNNIYVLQVMERQWSYQKIFPINPEIILAPGFVIKSNPADSYHVKRIFRLCRLLISFVNSHGRTLFLEGVSFFNSQVWKIS